jgi:hypothetical protein
MLVSPVTVKATHKQRPNMILDEEQSLDTTRLETLSFCAEGMAFARNFLVNCAQADRSVNLHDTEVRRRISDAHSSWRSHLAVCTVCSS